MKAKTALIVGVVVALVTGSLVAIGANTTIGVTPGTGDNVNLIQFGSTNVISETDICDFSAENRCGTVKPASTGASQADTAVVVRNPDIGTVGTAAGCTSASSNTDIQCLYQLHTDLTSALPAGSNTIGGVTLAAALPAGANTIGAVTQASGPWTINVTQVAGTTLGAIANYGTSPGAVAVPGVNAFVTNTAGVNITQVAGSTLGAIANYGTSPGAVAVPAVNAFITNIPAVSQNGAPWSVSASGNFGVTQSTSPWVNNITQFGSTNISTGTGASGTGIPRVTVSNDSNILATQSGTWTVQPGNTANTTPWLVTPVAGTTNAATPGNEIAPNNTTGVNLKASAGTVYSVQLGGIGSAPAYLKLYDKATAPTCGTDTPIKRLIIPANPTAADGSGSNVMFPVGVKFSNGIGYCVTTGITDADTTAPAASTFLINIDWN